MKYCDLQQTLKLLNFTENFVLYNSYLPACWLTRQPAIRPLPLGVGLQIFTLSIYYVQVGWAYSGWHSPKDVHFLKKMKLYVKCTPCDIYFVI